MAVSSLRAVEQVEIAESEDLGEACAPVLAAISEKVDRRLLAVATALRGLRGAASVEQLFRLIPAEVCRCGFARAWLSRVDGASFVPVRLHTNHARRVPLEGRMVRLEPAGLVHGSHEAEMVRRRRPVLAAAADDQLVDPTIARVFAPRSYVAAPLLVDTRVVAFLHADRPRGVADEDDLAVITVFAEAAGHALQRVILGERLERLRVDVRALTNSVGDLVDERCCEPIDVAAPPRTALGRRPEGAARPAQATGPSVPSATGSRLSSLLTSRELEVLRLMATGETNAGIAERLVISPGTVKSHVKNVLRKLHAANRAQAVSRYFQLVRAGGTA
jgi:DNA-binding CsgD family transcriptional regulator